MWAWRRAAGRMMRVATWVATSGACIDATPTPEGAGDGEQATVTAQLQATPVVTLSALLEPVACSANARCAEGFLVDPATRERVPSLLTGFVCGHDAELGSPRPDTLMAVRRRVACYDGGDPALPATWMPPSGHGVTPSNEASYGALMSAIGDAQASAAIALDDLGDYAFCRVEAWGVLVAQPLDAAPRAIGHRRGGIVAHWDMFVEPDGQGGFDCHLDGGGPSSSRLGYALGVTHGRPDPSQPGAYPATFDFGVLLDVEVPTAEPGYPFGVRHAVGFVFGLDATFPLQASGVGDFVQRTFDVVDPATGQMADVEVVGSCAEADADGELERILVEVEERWNHTRLGAIVIHRELDGAPFDCAREAGTSACALVPPEDVLDEAPCLVARPEAP